MSMELKPCPFCGSKELEVHSERTVFIMCSSCETRGNYYNTEAEAIEAWNTRADDNSFAYGNDAAYWHDEYEKLLRAVDVIRDATERTCEYCKPDEAGNLKWLRDEPDSSAWLEEYSGEWGIVTSATSRCFGRECTTEMYVRVSNCPMCGRELSGDAA